VLRFEVTAARLLSGASAELMRIDESWAYGSRNSTVDVAKLQPRSCAGSRIFCATDASCHQNATRRNQAKAGCL